MLSIATITWVLVAAATVGGEPHGYAKHGLSYLECQRMAKEVREMATKAHLTPFSVRCEQETDEEGV